MDILRRTKRFVINRSHKLSRLFDRPVCESTVQDPWPRTQPLISVIVPCYNYGHFIQEALDSVFRQTLQRFEIIVIDDGSTDRLTKEILSAISLTGVRVVTQTNQGLAETRNNGAMMAAGKYICFLDADDRIAPTYLEKTVATLESDASLGSCYSWVQCFGDRTSVWRTVDSSPFQLCQYTTASSHAVIRKQAWEDVKKSNGAGFLTKYNAYFEDWVFWIDMVECGYRGVVVEEPLILYRVHDASLGAPSRLTDDGKRRFEQMLKVLHKDRAAFFHDRAHRRRLERRLNRRVCVTNNRINL
jgi:O-antigen biosynthesis protein